MVFKMKQRYPVAQKKKKKKKKKSMWYKKTGIIFGS